MNSLKDLHKRLKTARLALNLKQSEVANELDIQQKSVSEIENGRILNIPNSYIDYFYKKSISLEWIYEGGEDMFIRKNKAVNENTQNKTTKDLNTQTEISSLENLFKDNKTIEKIDFKEGRSNDYFYERIINSKDFTIKVLLDYVDEQKNMIELLKKDRN